jgi:hypothetical protein
LKKQLLEEAKTKEKKQRLKLIASGFTPDPPNLVRAKKIIYNEILTPSNQKLMDKLDDELIAYAYKHNQGNKHNKVDSFKSKTMNSTQKSEDEKKLLSMDIMKTLCHYKMYSSLMSNDFKEFIIKNKKLEFNEPKGQKNSMDKIQKYLNRKMEITFNTKLTDADKEKLPWSGTYDLYKNKPPIVSFDIVPTKLPCINADMCDDKGSKRTTRSARMPGLSLKAEDWQFTLSAFCTKSVRTITINS